jgi:hypothetical protein
MNQYLEQIALEIKSKVQIFDRYYIGATKDEEGRVTIPIEVNGNERRHVGITDNDGSFFYIRHRDDFVLYEELTEKKRFSACESFVEKRFPLRLVTVTTCSQSVELESIISSILFSSEVERSSSIKGGRIVLRQSLVDSYSVLREEAKNPKKFDKFLQFIAIDFDLILELNHVCLSPDTTVTIDEFGNLIF